MKEEDGKDEGEELARKLQEEEVYKTAFIHTIMRVCPRLGTCLRLMHTLWVLQETHFSAEVGSCNV